MHFQREIQRFNKKTKLLNFIDQNKYRNIQIIFHKLSLNELAFNDLGIRSSVIIRSSIWSPSFGLFLAICVFQHVPIIFPILIYNPLKKFSTPHQNPKLANDILFFILFENSLRNMN